MRLTYREYILDEVAVDTISDDVQKYLKKLNAEARTIQRIRLTVEELLLNILERCGSGITVSVGIGIPTTAVILATTVGIVLDYLDTGVNVMLLIFRIACAARQFDDLDRSVLLRKSNTKT